MAEENGHLYKARLAEKGSSLVNRQSNVGRRRQGADTIITIGRAKRKRTSCAAICSTNAGVAVLCGDISDIGRRTASRDIGPNGGP